ncbi:unnamed protein product [marine sediment metagenome]|uniref:Uncharacterized protein n=1 Tax=marine sediment metagenome TaxID=412755 RepID=X0ZNX0_9ZZZZ
MSLHINPQDAALAQTCDAITRIWKEWTEEVRAERDELRAFILSEYVDALNLGDANRMRFLEERCPLMAALFDTARKMKLEEPPT